MILHIIHILRPSHYLKNSLVFAPLFFAQAMLDLPSLVKVLVVFLAFCLCASAVYIFNDYCDIENDRKHPVKRNRPLAQNLIPIHSAILLMVTLFCVGLGLAYLSSPKASLVLCFYCLVNVFYSLKGKHILSLDVSLIALGFVLRLYVGAYAADISLSKWIISLTFCSALFLALAKRRNELLLFQNTGEMIRTKIANYHLKSLNITIVVSAIMILLLYILYTFFSPNAPNSALYLSNVFVALGLLRYLTITFIDNNSGSPTQLLITDRLLQILVSFWLINFGWILY